jgi:hypothetical protein
MSSNAIDLAVNIAAGLLTAVLLWSVQWSLRRRRLNRIRDFFGLLPDTDALLVVNRHASSANELSVHRRDVFALLELAGLIKLCGARAEVVGHDEVRRGFGEKAEFCIGGPTSNTRTAAHLEWKLPGVAHLPDGALTIGGESYRRGAGAEYVLLAKVAGAGQSRPVFLVSGQTAVTNQAAVRYLVAHERKLARTHGTKGGFALVLRVVNPEAYGPDVVELVADVTDAAFRPPAEEPPAKPPATSPAATSPAATSPAATSQAATSQAATRPSATRPSAPKPAPTNEESARTAPARTAPGKNAPGRSAPGKTAPARTAPAAKPGDED